MDPKSKSGKKNMADNLHVEIQVEIMKRLPVKSLAVSRAVSKAWKSLIDSPLFITHYTNIRQQHRLLIRYEVVNTSSETEFKYVSIMDKDTLSQHEFETVCNVPLSFQRLSKPVLVGTSQGLLCLFGNSVEDRCYKETAVIWNPSLGKSIAIDVPCQGVMYATVLGFGVHPHNCDPMIIMINAFAHRCPVMVFTLSSRFWRVPRGNLLPKSIYFSCSSPVADDRCIYWKGSARGIDLVVAFDMVSEDFTEIDLPHSVAHRSFGGFSIFKIKESLALLENNDDAKKPVYGIWMMADDGVSKSFTKLFTINKPDASLGTFVVGFRKNNQPIMETTIDEHGVLASLEVYEPHTRTIKNLGINGVHGSFFLSSYTETLLLLNQLDDQFVEIQLKS